MGFKCYACSTFIHRASQCVNVHQKPKDSRANVNKIKKRKGKYIFGNMQIGKFGREEF